MNAKKVAHPKSTKRTRTAPVPKKSLSDMTLSELGAMEIDSSFTVEVLAAELRRRADRWAPASAPQKVSPPEDYAAFAARRTSVTDLDPEYVAAENLVLREKAGVVTYGAEDTASLGDLLANLLGPGESVKWLHQELFKTVGAEMHVLQRLLSSDAMAEGMDVEQMSFALAERIRCGVELVRRVQRALATDPKMAASVTGGAS